VTELILASGPLRYLGGSIESFALPYGAFIVIAWVLFYIYRRPHNVPRLKYLRPAHQIALATREPGTEGLITVASAAAPAAAQTAAAQTAAEPAEAEATATVQAASTVPPESTVPAESTGSAETSEAEETSDAEHDGTSAEGETF
jgi:hypothetical protein